MTHDIRKSRNKIKFVSNTTAGYVIMYIQNDVINMQNDVMMFKRRHLVLISIKLLKVPESYMLPEVINKLTLKRASNNITKNSKMYCCHVVEPELICGHLQCQPCIFVDLLQQTICMNRWKTELKIRYVLPAFATLYRSMCRDDNSEIS